MKCKYETTGRYDGMKRCFGTKEVDPCPGYEKCQHFKPNCMTNADHIRAMTDKELAKFLIGVYIQDYWDHPSDINGWIKQPYGGADHE